MIIASEIKDDAKEYADNMHIEIKDSMQFAKEINESLLEIAFDKRHTMSTTDRL